MLISSKITDNRILLFQVEHYTVEHQTLYSRTSYTVLLFQVENYTVLPKYY